MSKQNAISEYIENMPLKKHFCYGYRPHEVYDVICNLSSMYNQVLAEAYIEIEQLEHQLKTLSTVGEDSGNLSERADRSDNPKERKIFSNSTENR